MTPEERARRRSSRIRQITGQPARSALATQAQTRAAIRAAVADYAAHRATTGQHTDTVTVTLRDGTTATALIRVDLVPTTEQD